MSESSGEKNKDKMKTISSNTVKRKEKKNNFDDSNILDGPQKKDELELNIPTNPSSKHSQLPLFSFKRIKSPDRNQNFDGSFLQSLHFSNALQKAREDCPSIGSYKYKGGPAHNDQPMQMRKHVSFADKTDSRSDSSSSQSSAPEVVKVDGYEFIIEDVASDCMLFPSAKRKSSVVSTKKRLPASTHMEPSGSGSAGQGSSQFKTVDRMDSNNRERPADGKCNRDIGKSDLKTRDNITQENNNQFEISEVSDTNAKKNENITKPRKPSKSKKRVPEVEKLFLGYLQPEIDEIMKNPSIKRKRTLKSQFLFETLANFDSEEEAELQRSENSNPSEPPDQQEAISLTKSNEKCSNKGAKTIKKTQPIQSQEKAGPSNVNRPEKNAGKKLQSSTKTSIRETQKTKPSNFDEDDLSMSDFCQSTANCTPASPPMDEQVSDSESGLQRKGNESRKNTEEGRVQESQQSRLKAQLYNIRAVVNNVHFTALCNMLAPMSFILNPAENTNDGTGCDIKCNSLVSVECIANITNTGRISLKPFEVETRETSSSEIMIYQVIKGRIRLKLNNVWNNVSSGGVFFVTHSNKYSIINPEKEVCEFTFTQAMYKPE